jgi:DNA-directed RNA polymerase II subunit RPB2
MLPAHVVYDILASERAENDPAKHHVDSYQRLLDTYLPDIMLQDSREVHADCRNSIHLVEFTHVQIDTPVARTANGFWAPSDPATCAASRTTYTAPVVVDVHHRVYANTAAVKTVPWESLDPETVADQVAALIAGRPIMCMPAGNGAAAKPKPVLGPNGRPIRPRRGHRANISDKPLEAVVTGAAGSAPGGSSTATAAGSSSTGTAATPYTETWVLREQRTYHQVVQFHLPLMLTSGPARGTMCIKGSPKVILPQKKLATNRWMVFPATKPGWSLTAEIRALNPAKMRSTSTLRVHVKCGTGGSGVLRSVVRVPFIDTDIPLGAVCRLLGFGSPDAVAVAAATGGVLSGRRPIPPGSLWDMHAVHTTRQWVLALLQDDAHNWPQWFTMDRRAVLNWVGDAGAPRKSPDYRARTIAHLMANEFLPQMGVDSSPRIIAGKAASFAFGLWRLATVARGARMGPGRAPAAVDCRDHEGNRAYDTAGPLVAQQARQQYRAARKKFTSDIRRLSDSGRFVSIPDLLHIKRMSDYFAYCMATGNWGAAKGSSTQTGVTQLHCRLNPIAAESHLRRVNTPCNRDGKQAKPRLIHPSSWGLLCPAETPEGQACGLVQQLAAHAIFCAGHATAPLVRRVARLLEAWLTPLIDATSTTGAVATVRPRPSMRAPDAFVTRVAIVDHPAGAWDAVWAAQDATDAALLRGDANVIRVIVNGVLMGSVPDGETAARALRAGRAAGALPFDVAVELCVAQGTLTVNGEAGSLRRPLLKLDPGNDASPLDGILALHARHAHGPPGDLWRALLQGGFVEYVSKHEEEGSFLVALDPCRPLPPAGLELDTGLPGVWTHCELHPSTILGTAAGCIPLSEHNQAPRTTYYASMSKQTAGNPGVDAPGAHGLRLWYPQRPLVSTWTARIHGMTDAPGGMNAWVAVAADGGENQEDSLYVNQAAVDRGLFACFSYRQCTEDCAVGSGADAQRFEVPPPHCLGARVGCFDKLDPATGLARVGALLEPGDAYAGKTMDVNELGCVRRTTVRRDQSAMVGDKEPPAFVDTVTRCRGQNNRDLVAMSLHTAMFLAEGDKLSSTAGQKGVGGCVRPAVDMPYTASGITPDIVMNPHAFPSRMTIGQLLESALGLAAAHGSERDGGGTSDTCGSSDAAANGTPFSGLLVADVAAALQAAGFDDMGNVTMYSGATGEPIETRLFFGPTHYVRVRQMASAKAQARARGPVNVLTQQPSEGRVNSGGLRFGEMEVAAVAGHGCTDVLRDRLFFQSDCTQVPVCVQCGCTAMPQAPPQNRHLVVGRNEHTGYCANCRKAGTVVYAQLPYATKLLMQELAAMHIATSLQLDTTTGIDVHAAASLGVPRLARDADVLQPIVAAHVQQRRNQPVTLVTQVPLGFSRQSAKTAPAAHRRRGPAVAAPIPRAHLHPHASLLRTPKVDSMADFLATPAYMPASPAYMPASPAYMPASPAYMPASPDYMPASPAYMPDFVGDAPASPAYMPASPDYMPPSPAFMPDE